MIYRNSYKLKRNLIFAAVFTVGLMVLALAYLSGKDLIRYEMNRAIDHIEHIDPDSLSVEQRNKVKKIIQDYMKENR